MAGGGKSDQVCHPLALAHPSEGLMKEAGVIPHLRLCSHKSSTGKKQTIPILDPRATQQVF
jgi:hypothetical protein